MSKKYSLQLKHQACFPLYALSREITAIYRPLLDELNITYPQYLVLMILWENEEQTVNQIGKKLHLDSGTLTPLLKRMEAKGIVVRKRKTCDERVVAITLTSKGRDIKKSAEKIPEKVVAKLEILEDELKQLIQITNKILIKIK